MRPMYRCPENFRDSLTTPTATFVKILWDLVPMVQFLALHTYYSSISNCLPEILDCSFQWGLRTHNFGEGEAVAVGDGTIRKNVGEFL